VVAGRKDGGTGEGDAATVNTVWKRHDGGRRKGLGDYGLFTDLQMHMCMLPLHMTSQLELMRVEIESSRSGALARWAYVLVGHA